jgi:hypothetical protein
MFINLIFGVLVCVADESTRCGRARHAAWGESPVGGHGDILAGPVNVDRDPAGGPLLDFSCSLVMLNAHSSLRLHLNP